jgi:N-acylneuraminate cytidylyltransferase
MNSIAIIPARSGSVRIPSKNIKLFHGKPIIVYAIETAQKSGLFDMIVVSTDSTEIADIARANGAIAFMRSPDDGTRGTQDVAREVLMSSHFKDIRQACVIYATSPLLLPVDLRLAFHTMIVYGVEYVMSVQPDVLADAGCFYMGQASAFRDEVPLIGRKTMLYPLPPERCCDINVIEDWERAEQLYQRLLEGK